MINIAVLGYGTVGSGVVEVINKNHASINKRAGQEVNIKYVLDLRDFPGDPVEKVLVHDYNVIVNDPEVKIIVEVMGGIKPAYDFTKQALEAGKSVCTSNKELVAAHGAELLAIAKANKVNFLFEASVGGGIPIIRPLNQSLTADEITEITGILNGTTNYILSKMTDEGKSFEEVLKRAQEKGYAERNPEADVEGYDACRKIAILTSLALGKQVDYQDIYTEGITKITAKDVEYAEEFGDVIKLLGVAHNTEGGIEVAVHPMMIPKEHPLASVRDSFNAVFVHSDAADDTMFYGRGAGELPTASAIMGDVIDVIRDIQYHCTGRISCTCYRETPVKNFKEVKNKFYIRMLVDNKPGVLAAIASVFGVHKVSIARVIQKTEADDAAELVIVTEAVKEKHLEDALAHLVDMDTTREIGTVIREY